MDFSRELKIQYGTKMYLWNVKKLFTNHILNPYSKQKLGWEKTDSRGQVVEMKFKNSMIRKTRRDRARNKEVRERLGLENLLCRTG